MHKKYIRWFHDPGTCLQLIQFYFEDKWRAECCPCSHWWLPTSIHCSQPLHSSFTKAKLLLPATTEWDSESGSPDSEGPQYHLHLVTISSQAFHCPFPPWWIQKTHLGISFCMSSVVLNRRRDSVYQRGCGGGEEAEISDSDKKRERPDRHWGHVWFCSNFHAEINWSKAE